MPRRKSDTGRKIGNNSEADIRRGITLIRNGMSIRAAAKDVQVPYATLKRYYWNIKNAASLEGQRLQPNYSVNKVFTETQENELKEYIKYCALLFYGLPSKECRQLAYQCAKINNIKVPDSWVKNDMAGKDWLISFKRRHNFTTRRPEPCSLARATSFNRTNVASFFDNLENLINRNPIFADGTRIFNLDETSTSTVQKPQKIVAPKGKKCIGKVTSGERGTLVTTCCIISASGIALPPVMVFPRKNFKDHMIKNTPPGTLGLATPTGWMNNTIFPAVMKHFIKNANASKDNPCILIMDNHESHLSLEALNLAKDAGVHVLTLHPHTSGKLQPLDVGVYSPFKVYYNAAIDSWLMRNPGKPVTIYDLGEIIGIAFQKAMTPLNITKSFAKCGIYPFDRLIFTDEDFLPSSVTDRPCPDCAPREEGLGYTAISNNPNFSQSTVTNSNDMPGTSFSQTHSNESGTDEYSISANMPSPECATRDEEHFNTSPIMTKNTPHISESTMTNLNDTQGSSFSQTHSKESESDVTTILANTTPATLKVQACRVMSGLLSKKSSVDFPQNVDTNNTSSEFLQESHQESQTSKNKVLPVETCATTPPRLPLSNITEESINQIATLITAPVSSTDSFISPFAFRKLIKAGPRNTNRKRKAGLSMIATDTPEKLLLEAEKSGVKQRKMTKPAKITRKVLQSDDEEEAPRPINVSTDKLKILLSKTKKNIKIVKKKKSVEQVLQSDGEEDEETGIKLTDSEEYSDEADYDQDEDENDMMLVLTENHLTKPLPRPALEGEYVIVQFATKKLRSLYVGKILEGRNNDLEYYVSFLRRKAGTERFHVPDKPDLSIVKDNDVKYILPKPSMVGTSSRPMYCFPLDLSSLKLR